MKILVDEMPKEAKERSFAIKVNVTPISGYVCVFDSPCWLEIEGRCPRLKKYKPIKDDCK